MDIYNEFIARKKDLVFYSGKAILNKRHAFFDINNNPWDFSDATGFTFNIWEEREGGRHMIAWTSPTNIQASTSNVNEFILNSPVSDTSIERGKYYYEIEELTGGYSILLAYGEANFL